MKRLKIILLCSTFIIIIFCLITLKCFNYNYKEFDSFEGTIIDITKYDNRISFIIKNNFKILVNDYDFISDVKLGDYVKVKGISKIPSGNTNFYLFNYKNYLLSKKIYYTFTLDSIEYISNKGILYSLKNKVIDHLNDINNPYVSTMILAKNNLDNEIYDTYQKNGISHLFCVSGMHISFFILFLSFLLQKIFKRRNICNIFIVLFLVFYIIFTNYSPSVIRCSLFFIIKAFLDMFIFKIKPIYILIVIFDVLVIINPFYFYNVGFIYSFVISFGLLIFQNKLKSNNYFIRIFLTSLFCFLVTIPISINQNFSINLLTPLINVVFIPLVSFIIFPLSLLTFIVPFLSDILNIIVSLFERLSIIFSTYSINIIIPHLNVIFITIYYLILGYFLLNKRGLAIFILYIIFLSNLRYFKPYYEVTFLDVGQGDSIILSLPYNKGNYLIDTGGNYNYDLGNNVIIPSLKARGIKKLDAIITSHGDFDHLGEAIDILNNFKVDKIIFNCGEYDSLEKEIIDVLSNKNIPYYTCIKELNIDNNKLVFLQTKELSNENDNSNVIYTELDEYKFMFMGDAGVTKEKDILDKYNVSNIDVLKVGHHGSKTSSSEDFINEINPKYSVISVGKNNRYGHPNKEVLENLEESKIYRTDLDGSILFKVRNNKLQIETCSP